MIEVEISDFQSIRHIEVTIDKFAGILGRSNIGKSSIVRALQYALTGAVGTDFVRHGATCDRILRDTKKCKCVAKVRVKTSEIEFIWEKGDAANRYTVRKNGQEQVYNGLDRGTPEFLADYFQPVKVGESKELIQIPDQFDPIFLLNKSGTIVADVLSDVAQLDELNVAMAYAVKDKKDYTSTRKVRVQDIATLTDALTTYDGLEESLKEVQILHASMGKVAKLNSALNLIDGFIDTASALKTSMTALKAATTPSLPDAENLQQKHRSVQQLARMAVDSERLEASITGMMTAFKPDLPDLDALATVSKRHATISRLFEEISDRVPVIRKLSGVDDVAIPDASGVSVHFVRLAEMDGWLRKLSTLDLSLTSRAEPGPVPDVTPLTATVSELSAVQVYLTQIAETQNELMVAEKALLKAQQDEDALTAELEALGMCPTCYNPIANGHKVHLKESA